ncbi:MAG: tetratricopeptide repeat protein [Gammaproteobacteria bacterium]|nr:tetratricopeptide repeat protein [Gammaproteobacteria bacterium]MDH3767282.1 tetratricopeptide repeat protein [Gammaproteobacteria bacterium]
MELIISPLEKKEAQIRVLLLSLVAALAVPITVAGAAEYVQVSDAVSSYVKIRAEPTTEGEMIGALRRGKPAPLVAEREDWFEIELSGGITGHVSRLWTEKTGAAAEAKVRGKPLYATESYVAPADPDPVAEPRDRTVLARASTLLDQDRPQDAYALMSSIEVDWAGDSGFDYLYGVAALDSGNAGEAIFALERVIRSLPDFVGARMELARALYETGDRERAHHEFTMLLSENPPQAVRGVIEGYLDALSRPDPGADQPQKLIYAVAAAGYDSNANGAADINSFLGFTLDPRSTETDTAFAEAQFGALLIQPLRPNVELSLNGEVRHRHNPSADFVDHSFANTSASLGFTRGANKFITGVGAYWSALNSGFNERGAALDFGWQRALQNNSLQVTLRAGPVRFHSTQKVRDIDRVLYTLTLRQPLQGGNGVLDWVAIGGRDRAEDRQSAYSNTRMGGRFGARWKVSGNDLSFDLGFLKIPYNGNQPFFGIDRDDEQITTTLALEVPDRPFRGWTFIPNLRYVNNDSNVPLFDYDRIEVGVLFRATR